MADKPDIPDHLKPDFDPAKQTIQQLTSLLGRHGVTTPTSRAKKDVYVGLFKEHITPNRNKFMEELTKSYGKAPKNFGSGSLDADSGQGSSAAPSSAAPTPDLKTRRRRVTLSSDMVDPFKPGDGAGSDEQLPTTPAANVDDRKVFSDDNPFQSPPKGTPVKTGAKTKVLKKRRTTIAAPTEISDDEDQPTQIHTGRRPRHSVATFPEQAAASPQPFMFKMSQHTPVKAADSDVPDSPVPSARSRTGDRRKTIGGDLLASRRKAAAARQSLPLTLSDSTSEREELLFHPIEKKQPEVDEPAKEVTPSVSLTEAEPEEPSAIPEGNSMEQQSATGDDTWATVTPRKTTPPRPKSTKRPERRFKRPSTVMPAKTDRTFLITLLVFLAAATFGHWYWEARDVMGYCDGNETAVRNGTYEGYNPLGLVLPICRKCPPRGVCVDKTVLDCDHPDYILEPNLLTTAIPSKYLPFPLAEPKCVKDTKKQKAEVQRQQHIEALLNFLSTVVRTWIGTAECGGIIRQITDPLRSTATGNILGMPYSVARDELRNVIGKKWDDEKLKTYWDLAIQLIRESGPDQSTSDLAEIMDETGRTRLLYSTQPPIMSVSCRLKRSIWETSRAYWLPLSALGITVIFFVWFWYQRQAVAREARMIARLVEDVLDAVSDEAENYRLDPTRHPIPGLSVAQLKDYLLPHVIPGSDRHGKGKGESVFDEKTGHTKWHLVDERARDLTWEKVHQLVLKNSNVRETVMDLRGESHLVWQWIGSHALSPRRKGVAAARLVGSSATASGTASESGSDAEDKQGNQSGAFMKKLEQALEGAVQPEIKDE
ncbi:uncharacterized protein SPPG_00665 [Spizellomyces punctatus DAOM BR117]|uniref:LEM-like domain-containing protein n=1 Tax=Spizellomyces punctatus (strain DAOM BR117) TaxID=645134 RepID=A0A0L0HUF1_SPIPD|nr:uncharacterized protein SPPG_00665 [Spizellomyces punctatus DAOM BR117]KND04981.1 hypothetical protein SPPG_00665 [Spizellomyces punctatus DAOM BR117]|eukprot:XP_016613020.1 hypothetical protein SPPG_00665 [Spizellomyces punctatus DAOM BR117]